MVLGRPPISLRPKPKRTANPLALPVPSRLQDRTGGLKFKNLKPGWKAKSLALPVYRDSSGQTSLFFHAERRSNSSSNSSRRSSSSSSSSSSKSNYSSE